MDNKNMEIDYQEKFKVDAKENPFITSEPALGEDFFGREKQVNEILKFLKKIKDRYLLIYGQRRIGKTSLLLKIQEIVNESKIGKAVSFDLQNKARFDISKVLFDLAVQIKVDVEADIDITENDFLGQSATDFFKGTFLSKVFEKLGNNLQLILLFDEFDALGELEGVKGDPEVSNIAYYKFIPYLIEIKNKNYPLKFIFAVGRNYKDLDENRYGQITKFGSQIELSYFDEKELESLISLSNNILLFEPTAIKRIYELTAGHPFFSQCLASSAFDEAENLGVKSVGVEIIGKQFKAAVKSYGGGVVWLWKSFTPNEKIILYLMAVLKTGNKLITEKNLKAEASRLNLLPAIYDMKIILEKLIDIKIIKEVNNQEVYYQFYVEFFRKWIVIENSVEKIGMLLEKIDPDINHFLNNARYFYNKGEYTEAKKYFEELIERIPSHYESLFCLGHIYKNLIGKEKEDIKNIDEAVKWYSQAYRIDPHGAKNEYLHILNKKLAWLEGKGNETENIEIENVLKEIQRINPDDTKTVERLVEIYIANDKNISEIDYLSKVKELCLRNRGLEYLPKEIIFVENLEKLDLKNNKIIQLTIQIIHLKYLTELKQLYLGNNRIIDISFLKILKNLTDLDLSNNQISDVSPLKDLTNLTVLNLSNNQISDVSPLKDLTNLTVLNLSNNQITDISALKDLEDLYLTNNKISELPVEVCNWKGDLLDIFKGNPIKIPPMEIVKKGKKAVKSYFESLGGTKRVLNEVKMLLVGDGGAGKTSLVKRLIGERFDKNEPQTHGININHWEVESKQAKMKINTWDFGGQEIMHATHQFFLSKRSLYVLVLDGRKDEKTEYWLKHVKSFGGDSPVLVVINKIDANPGFDVNRPFLLEKYKNIKGFFRVSCATGEGIESFSKALINELAKVELIHTIWAESWFNIKTQLEKTTKNFISYEDYKTLCHEENVITKISRDTLVDFLHDLGVVLHFKDFKLQETHVINPEWVTTAVYKIIISKDIAQSKGLLKLSLLDDILKQEKDTDYYYPRDKYRYIIDLMQKFELCYEIDSETILIPDLLEIQESKFDFDYATALKFLIQYDFLPRSIMPRFMVKMHKYIKAGLQWRTGVVLEDEAFDCTGVVKSDDEEKRIYIYVQGEQKRDYFAAILHIFRELNTSFEKLEAVEKVPMPDEPGITVSYKHLIRLEQKGREYYEPDGSEKEYNVKQLLGTLDKSMYNQLLAQLENVYLDISRLEPQQRGFEFEKFLNQLFKIFDLNPRDSFKNTGEQIDGSFQLGNDIYLLEAKWQKNKIGQADLLVFDGKVSRKAKWTRGFFISVSGFTIDGQRVFSKSQPSSIIGMNGRDLEYILEGNLTLPEAISLKLRHAAETNEFFAPLPKLKKQYKPLNYLFASAGSLFEKSSAKTFY